MTESRSVVGVWCATLALVLGVGSASAQEPQLTNAEFEASPPEARIGEPIEWTLTVPHPVDDRVSAAPAVEVGDTWVALDGPVIDTRRNLEEGTAVTTVRWTMMSLIPGDRQLPAVEARFESGYPIAARLGRVTVRGELVDGEDEARPMADFHDIEERTSGMRPGRVVLFGGGALILGLVGFLMTRGRSELETASPPSPRERLSALEPDEAKARETAFELATVIRTAVDQSCGLELAGATDEEWSAALREDGRLSEDQLASTAELLAWTSEVRFGGAHPTRFRIEEQIARAQGVIDALGEISNDVQVSSTEASTEGEKKA